MTAKLHNKNDVVKKTVYTVARCVKVRVPDSFRHMLDDLYPRTLETARQMLKHRDFQSSKHWKDVPCVVAKSLTAKYQRNWKCKKITNLVIPICGDKGKQVKLDRDGIRVPALFKKSVLPVLWPMPISGHVRQIEFFRKEGIWFVSICYNTPCLSQIKTNGVIGIDRNSVGNVAVLADPQTGTVRKFGINPAKTKQVFRNRRANLQSAGKRRLLRKIRRKQSRRMTYENHRASKSIVDYAIKHRRAIVLENLGSVRNADSKIKRYSERNQWAFAQLETFIRYKSALHGIPIYSINPAFTSQRCSRCGSIHKPNGKHFECLTCGHNDHRDSNAAFGIGLMVSGDGLSVSSSGLIGNPQAGKVGANVH